MDLQKFKPRAVDSEAVPQVIYFVSLALKGEYTIYRKVTPLLNKQADRFVLVKKAAISCCILKNDRNPCQTDLLRLKPKAALGQNPFHIANGIWDATKIIEQLR